MAPLAEMLSVLMGPRSTHRTCVQPDEVFGAFDAGEFVRPGAPKDEQGEALTRTLLSGCLRMVITAISRDAHRLIKT